VRLPVVTARQPRLPVGDAFESQRRSRQIVQQIFPYHARYLSRCHQPTYERVRNRCERSLKLGSVQDAARRNRVFEFQLPRTPRAGFGFFRYATRHRSRRQPVRLRTAHRDPVKPIQFIGLWRKHEGEPYFDPLAWVVICLCHRPYYRPNPREELLRERYSQTIWEYPALRNADQWGLYMTRRIKR
jgi:hypothetical protein